MTKQRKISGTAEWAVANANCIIGCRNGCKYCFARYNACTRFKTIKEEDWTNEKIDWKNVNKKWNKINGTIMFQTKSDISPNTEDAKTLDASIACLKNILKPGNDVLIVSKPHIECITALCSELRNFKDKILFRFTIGAMDNEILKHWEPNAPSFGERFDCLQHAFKAGFKTSVSSEPMLDSNGVVQMFDMLEPYVTDAVWIGKMNHVRQRVKVQTAADKKYVDMIVRGQTDARIHEIYAELKDDPKVRWKESFKTVLGLELAQEAGTDK
jgi:DNA repair photolyase